MGVVFLAHDTLLDRPVAIKFVSAVDVGAAARERFFTEARAVARLSHPNVVGVYRVGEIKQRPYLISEYVRGTSLAALTKPVPWERALKIGIGLARGLGAAHRRGVLHRDIKPANVILGEDDEAKLLDFGLAKLVGTSKDPRPDLDAGVTSDRTIDRRVPEKAVDETISLVVSPGEPRNGHGRAPTSPALEAGMNQTQDGAIVGTPLYLAPELWQGAPATQASDVYALGSVLYELLAGHAPHAGWTRAELAARVPLEDVASIASRVANLPVQLAALIDACTSRDPSRRPGSGDALGDLLEAVVARAPQLPEGSPYRGLSTFEPEHRAMFFGRAAETRSVIERLRTETFVIVAGDSGAGKSSLCRAAVLPAIAEKSLAGKRWRVTTMVPGARPRVSLEVALSERRTDEGLLLFIDQLEELLTIADPREAAEMAERLADLVVATSNVRVLASARSDFLGRLAGLPGLGELLGRALFLLGPLGDRGLREAIIGPARALGYAFEEPGTIDDLVASGRRHLPLLQFALAELWDARDAEHRVIPAEALVRIGGVTGALARHADSVLAGMPSTERSAARAILLSLVTAERTRGRRSHSELIDLASRESPYAAVALEALVRGRLLVAQEAESGKESVYAIAHEALLHGWDTLRSWLDRDAEGRAVRQRIERAASEWDRLHRPTDALWNERLLLEAAGIDDGTLPQRDAAFLRASRRLARKRRARRWGLLLGAPIALAGVVLGLRIKAAHDRDVIVGEARHALAAARSQRDHVEALRRNAFAKFDSGKDSGGAEAVWREALLAEPAVERAYASVADRVELLLQDDPGRADARTLLSDILLERAHLADEHGRAIERDDLIGRLGVYGSADRWNAPARLSITTEPSGARVSLRRYVLSGGRWIEADALNLGATPILDRSLPPGSVLLQLTLPGRESIRLPIVLARGEAARIALRLPLPAEVPRGFVYVPPGRFLYGSADEEARAIYGSQPLHTVETGAYLIARNETTFGEWIEYLRDLPPAEQARRMPNATRQGFTVALQGLPGGKYQVTLGRSDHPSIVKEGELVHYPGRTSRSAQDWLRLPVTGVSFVDMLAYLAWLRETGRVPNARPCTEHEWERAARGADGRAYPHGERLEPDDANFDRTYGRIVDAFGPDEVGSHPASDSPFGVHDLAGNVWEWTASLEDSAAPEARGGGFFQFDAASRSEDRTPDIATRSDAHYGIRVCATPTTL